MRRRQVINGKVMRTPTLGKYDAQQPKSESDQPTNVGSPTEFNLEFVRDYPSTHDRDKALLVALGVDGDVPLAQARINAGLPVDGSAPAKLVAGQGWVAANDNTKLAAKAA